MLDSPVPPRPEPSPTSVAALLERVRQRWDDPRTRVGALLLAALITGFAWYQLGVRGGGGAEAATSATTATTRAAASGSAAATPDPTGTSEPASGFVLVHVAGAVAHPGVVRVRASARVNDAVLAAGGGLPGADLDRLNLAAKVADGQRIAVGLIGAPAPVESGTGGTSAVAGGSGEAAGPININTASTTELEELPGIGPSLAAGIIAEREKRGGFKDVGELQDVRGIGELRYADIKDLVTV